VDMETGKIEEQKLQDEFGRDKVKFLLLDVRSEENWTQVWDEAEAWLGNQF